MFSKYPQEELCHSYFLCAVLGSGSSPKVDALFFMVCPVLMLSRLREAEKWQPKEIDPKHTYSIFNPSNNIVIMHEEANIIYSIKMKRTKSSYLFLKYLEIKDSASNQNILSLNTSMP